MKREREENKKTERSGHRKMERKERQQEVDAQRIYKLELPKKSERIPI